MALQLSKSDMKHAGKRLQSLQHRIQSIKKKAEATTEKLLRTAETSGAAFAAGVIQGRTGGIEVVGVPLELALGASLNVLGYFGGAGKHSDHLNNVGDGFLAAYATTLGRGVGETWLEKSGGQKQVSANTQAQVAAKGVRLSPEEIAATAREAAGV
jgi:hypothetical protein